MIRRDKESGDNSALWTLTRIVRMLHRVGHLMLARFKVGQILIPLNIILYLYQIIKKLTGCPNPHAVIVNKKKETNHSVLSDYCDAEDVTEWLAPEGATEKEAEILIDIGCVRNIFNINLKNLKRKEGGTKLFTLYVSEVSGGPWEKILIGKLPPPEKDSCGPMQSFKFRYYNNWHERATFQRSSFGRCSSGGQLLATT